MKKNILKILSALACIFLAFNASAQRPIWVVGHACNSQKCLADAIADGGNGVEIDINSNADSCRTDWSVNHDGGYLSLSDRNSKNDSQRRYGEYSDMRYVSLEEYLNFPDMDKIAFLWLDLKTPEYAPQLVKHVHDILLRRYGSPNKVPFSILYGFYYQNQLTALALDEETGQNIVGLEWYKKYLWENEGLGLAREGSITYKYWTAKLDDLKAFYEKYNFPIGKHVMTNGYGFPYAPPFSWKSWISTSLIQARKWRDSGQYCVRTGTWSMAKPWHGVQMTIAEDISYHHSWQSECDLILIECRNEFALTKVFPLTFQSGSLKGFVEHFLMPNGKWQSYNKGRCRLARPLTDPNPDKFYK